MATDLTDKLSGAKAGSRELDRDMARQLNGSLRVDETVPHYTTSLDAIVALIVETLPDYDWIVARTNGGLTIHACCGSTITHFAETPALALCLALLRAIKDNTHD